MIGSVAVSLAGGLGLGPGGIILSFLALWPWTLSCDSTTPLPQFLSGVIDLCAHVCVCVLVQPGRVWSSVWSDVRETLNEPARCEGR